jgi:F0F1-type ATP synthase assembly protein I
MEYNLTRMNPYKILLPIIGYFVITALIGAAIGSAIDSRFGSQPTGTLGSLLVTYVISWVGIYIYLKKKKQV